MKKGLLLLITILVLSISVGCSTTSKQADSDSNTSTEETAKTGTGDKDFDKLNIISVEKEKEDRDSYDEEVITKFKITNNGDKPIKYMDVDFAYYDKEGNCISTDSRYHDVVIQPGKSAFVETFSEVKGNKDSVADVKAVKYNYQLPDTGDKQTSINLETKEVEAVE